MGENDQDFLYRFLYNNSPAEQAVEENDIAQCFASPNPQDLQEMKPVDFFQHTQSDVICSNVYHPANSSRLHRFDEDGFCQAPISTIYSSPPSAPIVSSFEEKNESVRENFFGFLTPNFGYKFPSSSPPPNYSLDQPERDPAATSSPDKNPHRRGRFTFLKKTKVIERCKESTLPIKDTTQKDQPPSQTESSNSPVLQPLFSDIRPLQSSSPVSHGFPFNYLDGLQREDAALMPPPPIPSPKRNSVTTLTARDVVMTLAANRLVEGPTAWLLYRFMHPRRYDVLVEHKALEIFIAISNQFHREGPNYRNRLKEHVKNILSEMYKSKSELSCVFMAAFERTRARYINAMARINDNAMRNMRQPSYHWGDITRLTDLNSAVIEEVVRLPGQRKICSDVIDWCVHCFKAWQIDAWVDIKGGWEAILISDEGHQLFTASKVVKRRRKV